MFVVSNAYTGKQPLKSAHVDALFTFFFCSCGGEGDGGSSNGGSGQVQHFFSVYEYSKVKTLFSYPQSLDRFLLLCSENAITISYLRLKCTTMERLDTNNESNSDSKHTTFHTSHRKSEEDRATDTLNLQTFANAIEKKRSILTCLRWNTAKSQKKSLRVISRPIVLIYSADFTTSLGIPWMRRICSIENCLFYDKIPKYSIKCSRMFFLLKSSNQID